MTTTNFLFEEKTGTEYEGALMWSCKRHSTVELYKETAGTEVDIFEGTDCIIEGVRVDFTHAFSHKDHIDYVSDEWIDDFLKFKEDMYNSYLEHKAIYGDDTSIDRIDNDGNYCKENCRWATVEEQQNNTRITNKYNIPGYEDQYSIRELINSGIAECKNYDTIKGRLNRGGLDIQEAIMDLEGRRKAKAPISFYDDNGNKIQDPYNNRH